MGRKRESIDARAGLDLWGPVGKTVFLNWPRGSWQYDLICALLVVLLLLLPA
jgi:hypothetical protein